MKGYDHHEGLHPWYSSRRKLVVPRGAAEAPKFIRGELHSDAYSSWSETGIDLSANRLVDRGDVVFDASRDARETIEERAGEVFACGTPAIFLGGDQAS